MKKRFDHGEKISELVMDGGEIIIKDAAISIDEDGTTWVCQNDIDPTSWYEPEDKLGYKYALQMTEDGRIGIRKSKCVLAGGTAEYKNYGGT